MRDSKMSKRLDPLPLENRRFTETDSAVPRVRLKMTPVALVSHIGLCIVALALPIFVALAQMPVPSSVALFQKTGAYIGVAAMATLPVICIGLIRRKQWSRSAMLGFAWFEMVWESIKLVLTLFFYVPVYKRLMTDTRAKQFSAAASTQPATRPAAFDSFTSYGIYIMAVVTWLIFFGYAFAARRAMHTTVAREQLRG